MKEEELLEKYRCNNLGVFIDQYLTCEVAYGLLKTQFKEIERLNNIINELDKLIEQYSKNDYYYKYDGKYLKSEIINDLKTIRGTDKPRKGEVVSLEELESYLPQNTIEEEYDDWFWG